MRAKLLVIMPDGVGLKNFVFSDFKQISAKKNIQTIYWNSTPFDLEKMNLNSIALTPKTPVKVDLLKRAKIDIELDYFKKRFKSQTFQSYKFKSKPKSYKSFLKILYVDFCKLKYRNKPKDIQKQMDNITRRSKEYLLAKSELKKINPSIVFCTNQRSSSALAPVLAAKDMGIPTACFIFSWDNLPKATKVINSDFYFVWSEYMKNELRKYYENITDDQIRVTGSPQFEPHFNLDELSIEAFKIEYNIRNDFTYILFSGDDITTSPKDEEYLDATCKAIIELNKSKIKKYHLLFRPCPVDFSNRYDHIIQNYKSIITVINPLWEKQGSTWNAILPTREDSELLANTIRTSSLVVNLGSSMVFDAVCHNTPTAYINFNPVVSNLDKWNVERIYKFKHFESMPNQDAVLWINSKEEMADKILEGLSNPQKYVDNAKNWFKIINKHPADKASGRIAESLSNIIKDHNK